MKITFLKLKTCNFTISNFLHLYYYLIFYNYEIFIKDDIHQTTLNFHFSERESDEDTDNILILRKRGQLMDLPSGGAIIESSPTMPIITIPPELRFIPIEDWNEVDLVWLNM